MSLVVTEKAAEALKGILEKQNAEPKQVVRLMYEGGNNLKMSLSAERKGDQVVTYEEEKVMVIEKTISDKLDGTILDIKETPSGPAFSLYR